MVRRSTPPPDQTGDKPPSALQPPLYDAWKQAANFDQACMTPAPGVPHATRPSCKSKGGWPNKTTVKGANKMPTPSEPEPVLSAKSIMEEEHRTRKFPHTADIIEGLRNHLDTTGGLKDEEFYAKLAEYAKVAAYRAGQQSVANGEVCVGGEEWRRAFEATLLMQGLKPADVVQIYHLPMAGGQYSRYAWRGKCKCEGVGPILLGQTKAREAMFRNVLLHQCLSCDAPQRTWYQAGEREGIIAAQGARALAQRDTKYNTCTSENGLGMTPPYADIVASPMLSHLKFAMGEHCLSTFAVVCVLPLLHGNGNSDVDYSKDPFALESANAIPGSDLMMSEMINYMTLANTINMWTRVDDPKTLVSYAEAAVSAAECFQQACGNAHKGLALMKERYSGAFDLSGVRPLQAIADKVAADEALAAAEKSS